MKAEKLRSNQDRKRMLGSCLDIQQEALELWEYEPELFAKEGMADMVSVILSFDKTEDERIEEALEEVIESMWGK